MSERTLHRTADKIETAHGHTRREKRAKTVRQARATRKMMNGGGK